MRSSGGLLRWCEGFLVSHPFDRVRRMDGTHHCLCIEVLFPTLTANARLGWGNQICGGESPFGVACRFDELV